MRKFIIVACLLLAACDTAQKAVDSADYVCKDGVEYFVYEKMSSSGSFSFSVVPHFKPDGSLYTCTRKQ